MTRIKAAATRAPQTLDEATVLCTRFAAIDVDIALIETARAEAIAAANAAADGQLVALIAERKDISKRVQPWWEANIDALTGGKRKSIELGGAELGNRLDPPRIVFAHGTDDDAVVALRAATLDRFVRVKPSPDKPALLKALDAESGDEAGELLREIGFAAEQKEKFFIVRIAGATVSATQ